MSHPEILRALSVVKASYWFADNESPNSKFPIASIDSTLFTHLICAFANLDSKTYQVTISPNNSYDFSYFTATVRESNPNVITLLSIGGPNAEKTAFASMASDSTSRKLFIDSSIDLARSNGFFGLDLDWEFPENDVEMSNYGKLLDEWRAAVDDESDRTGKVTLLLTAAVYYSPEYYSVAYPMQAISDNLDWVNLKSYDFYGPGWSKVTGPPAAIYDSSNSSGRSVDSGLKEWLEGGLPAKKAVLGFPYYGWAWRLENADKNGYNAPTNGAAITFNGAITYDKLRNYIVDNGAATVHDPAVIGHYCCTKTTWIGYDDNQSVVAKVRYAKQKGLLGYFSYHVGADYNCGLSRAAHLAWDTKGAMN